MINLSLLISLELEILMNRTEIMVNRTMEAMVITNSAVNKLTKRNSNNSVMITMIMMNMTDIHNKKVVINNNSKWEETNSTSNKRIVNRCLDKELYQATTVDQLQVNLLLSCMLHQVVKAVSNCFEHFKRIYSYLFV